MASAWDNTALPIGAGQTISQPVVVARMCELLELQGDERVLDVGTGSGYHAAVLAQLAAEVWSIEREPQLSHRAALALEAAGVHNVHLVVGDGSKGHPAAAPYDAINVGGGRPGRAARCAGAATRRGRSPGRSGGRPRPAPDAGAQDTADGFVRTWHEPVRFVPLVEG